MSEKAGSRTLTEQLSSMSTGILFPRRGEIYIIKDKNADPSSKSTGKPGLIVSNSELNEKTNAVSIAYMSKDAELSENFDEQYRFRIPSPGCAMGTSTVICDRPSCIRKDRLGEYLGCLTDEETAELDRCLINSMDLWTAIDEQANKLAAKRTVPPTEVEIISGPVHPRNEIVMDESRLASLSRKYGDLQEEYDLMSARAMRFEKKYHELFNEVYGGARK